MIIAVLALTISSLIASGILWRHSRITTYLAAAGTLAHAQWLLFTFVQRTFLPTVSSTLTYSVLSVIILLGVLLYRKQWHSPYETVGSGKRDAVVLGIGGLIIAATLLIQNANGFIENTWQTHGFYNGDTATFISLVQKARLTHTLPDENPFANNEALEYPTLLHAGVATLTQQLNLTQRWFHFLPVMTLVQIILTIPLFWLLWDRALGTSQSRTTTIVSALSIFYVITLSWDNYVYPQSHFFLTNLYLLLACLLFPALNIPSSNNYLRLGAAVTCTLVLLASNAVTGTAALGLMLAWHIHAWWHNDHRRDTRQWHVLAGVIWILIFLAITPGNASFGLPGFSYTATADMVRLAIPTIAVLILLTRSYAQHIATTATLLLVGMGFLTFFFSTRDIVVANASRFFYHALLISFPWLGLAGLSAWQAAIQQLKKAPTLFSRSLTSAAVGVTALFIALPSLAAIAQTHDNLQFKDEQTVSVLEQVVLNWINDNLPANAVIVANPEPPWSIPIFTGRALLRTNYWLSPGDELQETVTRAFAGDTAAQAEVLQQFDYLFIRSPEEAQAWQSNLPPKPLFSVADIAIYATNR